MRLVQQVSKLLAAACVLATASTAFAADDGAWTVSKSSGEVWLTSSGVQPASLQQEELLKPGDTVRTGRTGRVLLRRGEETMLISPNSVVGMPAEKKEGLSTTIVQQAGSILLEVEKRNVKHFEVETPYLAAVVKGTQFRVTINAGSTSVDVIRGQVEVADFRSGQVAQVMPGQHATTFTQGKLGLSLSGSGTLSPIEQGKPRAPTVERIQVPRAGLAAPTNTASRTGAQPSRQAGTNSAKPGVTRISSSMGEVRLNFHRVTHGLARDQQQGHDLEFIGFCDKLSGCQRRPEHHRQQQQHQQQQQLHDQQRQHGDQHRHQCYHHRRCRQRQWQQRQRKRKRGQWQWQRKWQWQCIRPCQAQ